MSLPRLAILTGTTLAATLLPTTAAQASAWPGHPDRSIVRHVVAPGETATGLAVRYHAWTAELIALNHLGRQGVLHRGEVIRIPVVLSAVKQAAKRPVVKHHAPRVPLINRTTPPKGWSKDDLSRTEVRSLVTRMAKHYDVPTVMALAIAWQESGWQQRRVSSDGAIGVMQVMPDTGRWMRWYAGRPLRLRDTHDNVQAGVLALRVLRSWTKRDRNAIAAYYQGLGAVRRHGYFEDTKAYVAAVRAHERSLRRTGSPR